MNKIIRTTLILLYISSFSLYAQSIKVTGKVLDNFDEMLPGVTIRVRGMEAIGTVTDVNGEFNLTVPSDTCVLLFSFIGYKTEGVKIGKSRIITVRMKEAEQELDEVVVVAFGKQKKASMISSIQSVDTKDLKIASSNLTTAFAGKIPGIISYQTTGEPGNDNAQFFVRGVTTFGYKTDPLILIDGFEASSSDLARMQPDDIAAFSILKDATATAMYGPRGANGIILVTTKSGEEGPAKVNIRIDSRISMPTKMNKFIDGVSYMKLYNEALLTRRPTENPYYSEQKIQATEHGQNPIVYPNVQWLDELFKSYTNNTKANINLSGGGTVAKYYVSCGYDYETGLLKVDKRNNFNNNININRFNIRSNIVFKLTKSTILDTRIQGRFENYNGPYNSATEIYSMIMAGNPVDFPVEYEPDEANQYARHILFGNAYQGSTLKSNPYAEMVKGYQSRKDNTITAMATLNQKLNFLTEGLDFQAKVSATTWSSYNARRKYLPYYYMIEDYDPILEKYKLFCMNSVSARSFLGGVEPYRDATNHFYFESRLNWNRKFDLHNIGLMTVFTAEENQLTGGNSSDIFTTLPERNVGNSGRFTYDYDTRYFFEFVYGYNGSEKFTGDNKFGFFPSVGAGWLISNESFWKSIKNAVSLLKLKLTWGKVGNDAIARRSDRFWFLSNISVGSGGAYTWGKTFQTHYGGYNVNRIGNPYMTWETADKINLGLEVGVFKDEALKLTIDFFKDYRSKIYSVRSNIPSTTGWSYAPSGNAGKAESQGFDGSVDLQHFFNEHFWITGRFNMTYSSNKYTFLDEINYPYDYLKRVGKPIHQLYGLVAERLFVDQAEIDQSPKQDFGMYMAGDIKYKDINNDGVINNYDIIPMGYPGVPEIQYGFGLSSGYKKMDFSFFFQGSGRSSFFINSSAISPFVNGRNALSFIADHYWSESNPDVHAFFPRLSTLNINNNSLPSSWWLRNGSFLRLKTIETGYNFSGFKSLKSARLYFSCENVLLFSSFKLWDPEVGGNGLNYPLNKVFNLGLQIFF